MKYEVSSDDIYAKLGAFLCILSLQRYTDLLYGVKDEHARYHFILKSMSTNP